MNSSLVKRKFEKSMETYNENAYAQREIAEKLSNLVLSLYPHTPAAIFEIGCGTGLLTKKMINAFADAQFYVNDINDKANALISELFVNSRYLFIPGDAQLIRFPKNVDLLVSSSVIQWFDNLSGFGQKAYECLSNTGYMFLSTFGKKNLKEIRQITGAGLEYASPDELRSLFADDFEILNLSEEEIPVKFNSPVEILSHLRHTGVNAGCSGIMKTRSELNSFCNQYNQLFSNETTVILTYNPIYLALKKKI
ncbi:MAG: malonyl-ACP O-methyltransferase BioC [Prevotellaceae bacterium]|jgi:malonyl-CoA O-methyltransferase|nr:malonyl-ACP O-methyltransferase BioC [Prevotellaceae bacterium]